MSCKAGLQIKLWRWRCFGGQNLRRLTTLFLQTILAHIFAHIFAILLAMRCAVRTNLVRIFVSPQLGATPLGLQPLHAFGLVVFEIIRILLAPYLHTFQLALFLTLRARTHLLARRVLVGSKTYITIYAVAIIHTYALIK